MKQFFNLRWFIQHLIDENEYQYDDNEWTNPLSESNWTYQTNETFMKYVNFILKEMTPEQLKQNPITVFPESNTDEQESTISNKEEEKYSTFSDMSKQDSESDINDRIPSTTPGAEPPRDARDSGSARSHSTHLETSSSDRP